jgi:hypothetical protein
MDKNRQKYTVRVIVTEKLVKETTKIIAILKVVDHHQKGLRQSVAAKDGYLIPSNRPDRQRRRGGIATRKRAENQGKTHQQP